MQSTRSFFINGVIILLVLTVIIEVLTWRIGGEIKMNMVNKAGGILPYFSLLIRGLLLPEITTVFILALLTNGFLRWFKIRLVEITWESLIRYELSFLPLMLVAYPIYIPFNQSVRFLLKNFPDYSFDYYWDNYIVSSYSLTIYLKYLIPTMLISYGAINLSLAGKLRKRRSPLV